MRNVERIKKEIDEIKYDLGDLQDGSRLKHLGMVFDKCFNSENSENIIKELEEILGEDHPLLDFAKVLLKSMDEKED